MGMFKEYDVVVVGAGHAGCEAAVAAANMGSKVMLITMNLEGIAQMSCNPAMGGIAKGQIVREIDAMGGYSGIVTDSTMIQFRMLNRSKGPAMWSPRAQSDRFRFSEKWRLMLEQTPNIDFWQDAVVGLIIKNMTVTGVKTAMGQEIFSRSVILTNGTFLNGLIHIGTKSFSGGRMGDSASLGITEQLVSLGFDAKRMKTGTPVRVDGRTIDFSKMLIQPGDEIPGKFSYTNTPVLKEQRPCYLTYTSKEVHDILKTGFSESPMFTGRIEGIGPRYCPSIEDKIERFAGKERHQLFVEPEGWNTVEYYVNGFSSSLPDYIQYKALRKIAGFENAKIFRPGYAIEYDYFPPVQLNYTLETRLIQNLYFAGQINGTTGYEEAGAQGMMAGINAHLKLNDRDPFILKRSEAYIGVLIDDLITKGVDEPYRMFTSRAEYRILLRQDNADIRLSGLAHQLGLIDDQRMNFVDQKRKLVQDTINFIKQVNVDPDVVNGLLESCQTSLIKQKTRLSQILLRPQINMRSLVEQVPELKKFVQSFADTEYEVLDEVEILVKYEGYIVREQELADKLNKFEQLALQTDFDYHSISALSYEARDKLNKFKPATIGQASRISGVSPADISVLLVFMGR